MGNCIVKSPPTVKNINIRNRCMSACCQGKIIVANEEKIDDAKKGKKSRSSGGKKRFEGWRRKSVT